MAPTRVAPVVTMATLLGCLATGALGCVYGLSYEGQPKVTEPHAKIVSTHGDLVLVALNDQPLEYPSLGPIELRDGGFAVRVRPGRHVLLCSFQPRNPDASGPGESKRLSVGPPQLITLDVEAGVEIQLEPRTVGFAEWELEVRSVKPLTDSPISVTKK